MPNNNNNPVQDKDVVKTGNGPRNADSEASEPSTTPSEPTKPVNNSANSKNRPNLEERMTQMLSIVEAQQKTIDKMNEDKNSMEKMISSVADKARLNSWEDKINPQNFNIKKMRLAVYNGKVVLAWSDMKANNVFKKDDKAWVEELKTTIIYEDGTKEDVHYKQWFLDKEKKDVVLKLDSIDPVSGTRIVTVEDSTGNTYNVDVRFVNP